MNSQVWSFVIASLGLISLYFAGKGKAFGWLLGFVTECLWLVYVTTTQQWGFIITGVVCAVINGKNWLIWKRKAPSIKLPRRTNNMPFGVYVRKPTEVKAIQFTGDNFTEIVDFFGGTSAFGIYKPEEEGADYLLLTTMHGDKATCIAGDWVIPDNKPDTFYPCKPDVFAATYDFVKDAHDGCW